MRDRRLERVEAGVEREERMTAQGDDRLVLGSLLCRSRNLRRRALAGDRLRVDPVALRERLQARLTLLDRATDRLRHRGAVVKNLPNSASLHADMKGAPSNPGIKHLADPHDGLAFIDLSRNSGVDWFPIQD